MLEIFARVHYNIFRISGAKLNIGVSPSGKATDSDSVIRWFESSYPSHGYHILYKECASKYNIWFLFYMRLFSPL